jgi:hypothetical protein
MAVALTAVFAFASVSSSFAASSGQKAQASYRSSNASSQVLRAGETPANCIREACGRLWCWHMRGSSK